VNLFFVYFSILRGIQRGQHWQKIYLFASIMQILIEIILYETSECAIVHFVIPSLVHDEIRDAAVTLHHAIQKICTSAENNDNTNLALDAPQYLFVSTNVAKKFPDLLESIIVLSYHSYLPGKIGSEWRIHHSGTTNSTRSRFMQFASTSIIMQCLQKLGTMPGNIQRIIIHTIQPFIVSSLIILWLLIMKRPYVAVPVGLLIIYILYRMYSDVKKYQRNIAIKSQQVLPTSAIDNTKMLNHAKDTAKVTPSSQIQSKDSNGSSRPGSGESGETTEAKEETLSHQESGDLSTSRRSSGEKSANADSTAHDIEAGRAKEVETNIHKSGSSTEEQVSDNGVSKKPSTPPVKEKTSKKSKSLESAEGRKLCDKGDEVRPAKSS
jgi:hypothetical protein